MTWNAVLALLAGFAVIAALAAALHLLLLHAVPAWRSHGGPPSAAYLFTRTGIAVVAALGGGFVTVWLAPGNPLGHMVALAIAAMAVAAVNALFERGRRPLAYQLLLVLVLPIGVLAGGLLRLKLWGWF